MLFPAALVAGGSFKSGKQYPPLQDPPKYDYGDPFKSTVYPMPRFVSLARSKTYVRVGPGKKYPISWVFNQHDLPVEVILEYEQWRKIKDHEGQEGWVYGSLLSGKRTGLLNTSAQQAIYNTYKLDRQKVAMIQPLTIFDIDKCNEDWCHIHALGYKGWLKKEHFWGAYPDEEF